MLSFQRCQHCKQYQYAKISRNDFINKVSLITYKLPQYLRKTDKTVKKENMHSSDSQVQLKDRKISTDLMFMLGLCETIDQLAMANSVRQYGYVLRREDGRVLRRALDFEVGQRKKGKPKKTWKKQVDKESVKIGLRMEDALCRSKWSIGVNQNAAVLR